jgi:hypothetical protein
MALLVASLSNLLVVGTCHLLERKAIDANVCSFSLFGTRIAAKPFLSS